MAFLIAQGGASLYKINLSTGVATTLTLPSGVTLSTTRKPRFAVLNQWVAMVNSPTQNLVIDPEGTVRVMVPRAPTHPPTVVAGSSTGLSGGYKYRYSFVVLDSDGNLLQESPLSPVSTTATLAATDASLTDIMPSLDTVSARRIYRTLSNGALFFHLLDVEGNVGEALIDNAPDATLTLLPALSDTLVSPPGTLPGSRFKLITEWKSRLWGISDDPDLLDRVFGSETNKVYAWPNSVVAYPVGEDGQGLTGFAVRKNQLGLIKRSGLWQISGSAGSTGIAFANISVQQIAFGKAGSLSPDTSLTVNDRAYYLGRDGVYEWSDNGVMNISNEQVAPWFQTDTYFNRTRFSNAFARYNELRNSYELHLAAAGSSVEDRWVSFNLTTRRWYGPHKTGQLTPTHAAGLVDGDGLPISLVGGADGVVYLANSTLARDGAATAIDFDCTGPWHHADAPDIEHFWGQLSVLSRIESGGTLTVTPTVGRLGASAQATISHDLTTGREILRRLGDGALMQLRFQQATVNRGVSLFGYEVAPVFENGRR